MEPCNIIKIVMPGQIIINFIMKAPSAVKAIRILITRPPP